MAESVDMAAAHNRLVKASSGLKRAKSALVRAEDSVDHTQMEYNEAHDEFRTASRSVIAGNR